MGSGNIFQSLLSSLFGGNDPAAAKKRALKNIFKNLQKSKFKFYKLNSNEVEPALAKFIYEIYKVISPCQQNFQTLNPNALKSMVINHSLTQKQKELLEDLSESAIIEASRKTPLKELSESLKEKLDTFSSEFNSDRITKTDALYTKLVSFSNFIKFDYYFLLKKFDNTLKERTFTKEPRFIPINGTYIVEDLKNFIDVAFVLQFDADWSDIFKLYKIIKGADPFPLSAWKRILTRVRNLRDKHVLEMVIQLISENPLYKDEYKAKDLYLVDDYLSDIRKVVETTLEDIKAKQTAGKVEGYLTQIFGTSEIDGLKYYNEAGSAPFERKSIGAFEYYEPLGYLKQFIIEYVKKDVRELSDILLVRGEWANQQLAAPMSDAYHKLCENADKIIALDNSLNETVDLGLKMKTLLPRTERDKDSRNIIQSTLETINNTAGRLILDSVKLFVIYDRNLKMILEDCVKKTPALIINWKDIDHFAEGQLKDMSIAVYKKIFAFVSLLQTFQIQLTDEE